MAGDFRELSHAELSALEKRLDEASASVDCQWHWVWECHRVLSGRYVDLIRVVLRRDGVAIHTRMGKDHTEAGERLLESIALMKGAA